MKIIFMGTPDFSVYTMECLYEAGHELILAVSQPDKPKGRGKTMQPTPVKAAAERLGIAVYQPKKIREPECISYLESLHPDIIVVVAFGQILPEELLRIPSYGCINVHASLLPQYRGAAPIQWAVMDGAAVSGVTTMRMDAGLDTGDMILKTEVVLQKNETGGSLFQKLSVAGARLCVETLHQIESGTAVYTRQNHQAATYTTLIKKQTGCIDWNRTAAEIERLIRALNPWPSAYTILNGKMMKIWQAMVVEETSAQEPGTVSKITDQEIYIQTGEGILAIQEIQLEGKKRMHVDAFLRGYDLSIGTVLGND